MSSLNELGKEAHATAVAKGWYDLEVDNNPMTKFALIHSEVSEAIEAWRESNISTTRADGKPEGVASEMADVIIRVVDLALTLGIDLDAAVAQKMAYNATRPYRHGHKRA